MKIIAGLGNPGQKYTFSRHNAGFLFMDYISQKHNIPIDRLKFKALMGQGMIGGEKVVLLKPQTFMNLSGEAVAAALDFYKLTTDDLIIVYDDITIPTGRMRIRMRGSDGGHNGIKSVIYLTGSDVFDRIKLGCGAERHEDFDMVDFVLSGFSDEEKKLLFEVIENAADALCMLVRGERREAQNKYNGLDLTKKEEKSEG
ncbi:MAG: aminoacyl-tRNA hydrolase [Clostridia bacterium]|nr:aminoacyl-tRNA hydrolase [Clostridia bacterium]MBQ1376082.1 aminoacyl-tRNA hydrolase [Clostridia bacterium]